MSDYYYLAILEIVHAKSLVGYMKAIRFMLNHELNIEPKQFGRQKAINMAKELKMEHENLKEWRPRNNKETNREIAEEAYRKIADKYIRNQSDNRKKQ